MSMAAALLPEFDQEMANSRKTLERVPDEKMDWRPHEKSLTMGELASHIPNILVWVKKTIEDDFVDMSPGNPPPATPQAKSSAEAVSIFDQNVKEARALIAGASDEELMTPWSLKSKDESMFTMPRIAVLRSFIMNHSIHHRAQLCLYLRLNDVAMPAIYGPSADEKQ
jgi:uncharacterized damage-inducible protein DinB